QTTASQAPTQAANGVVNLDLQAQRSDGIRVDPAKPMRTRTQLEGFASVLGVTDLVNARNSYFAAARTNLQRDRANLDAARIQYQRVKKLYDEDQNMSLKAAQDAETSYRNAQAQLNTDLQDARLQLDVVRQRWGNTLTKWVENDAPILESVLQQRNSFVQVTFPPGEIANPPAAVSLELPRHRFVPARFVSALPQVNAQIQSPNFLYIASEREGLAVGANVVALVPVGRLSRGTLVPESAVVWWQGEPWVYEQTASGAFARRSVPTNDPVDGGYFVPESAIPPGSKIVTTGASALLSQELLVHSQGDEGDSDDDD
ncbi:MAG: hypothetical protein ACRD3S_21425, partial [Terracidiphilus sp.]